MLKECLPVLGESRNPWPQAGHNNCSKSPFALSVRGGAVAARWAHNPKVVGSNPTPATSLGFGRRRPPWSQLQSTHPLNPFPKEGGQEPGQVGRTRR